MSRSNYSEDGDGLNLWRGAVRSAIQGKRGQSFLKRLATALDAMPKKELIQEQLISKQGEVCTIGVVCKAENIDVKDVDVEDSTEVAKLVDIAPAMAAEIEFLNDESEALFFNRDETPQERWVRMRKWVKENTNEY